MGDIYLQNSSMRAKSDAGVCVCVRAHHHMGKVSKVSCVGSYYRRVSTLAIINLISVVSIRY